MNFKLRLDWDCYQRVLLAFISSICLGYLLSFLMWSSTWWISVLVSLTSTLAVLQSSLQLEVEDKAVLITGCDTGFGLALAKHLRGLLAFYIYKYNSNLLLRIGIHSICWLFVGRQGGRRSPGVAETVKSQAPCCSAGRHQAGGVGQSDGVCQKQYQVLQYT